MRPRCIIDLYHVDQSDCFISLLILDTLCLLLIVHLVSEYMDQDLDSCIRHSLPRELDDQTIKVSNDRGKGKEGERNVSVITSPIITIVVI